MDPQEKIFNQKGTRELFIDYVQVLKFSVFHTIVILRLNEALDVEKNDEILIITKRK